MSIEWDTYFLRLARLVATRSKDTTQVGCVIVGPDREIRTTGYNGFVRGIDDTNPERYGRPEKYKWFEHAERNAIYNAARCGIGLLGCTAYVPWFPCMDCGRALAQSGISELVCLEPDFEDQEWGEDFRRVVQLMTEAGVAVRYVTEAA